MAGSWMARANENARPHGIRPLNRAFIALSRAEASSPDWPPERNATPGTAAGTVRSRQCTVASAISSLRVLVRALQSRHHHVGLQNHALEQDALGDELSKNGVQGSFRHLGAALHGVVAVHQHFGLDDRHQAGLLAERGIESEDEGIGLEASLAGNAVADGDDGAPLGESGHPVFTYSARRSRSPSSPS